MTNKTSSIQDHYAAIDIALDKALQRMTEPEFTHLVQTLDDCLNGKTSAYRILSIYFNGDNVIDGIVRMLDDPRDYNYVRSRLYKKWDERQKRLQFEKQNKNQKLGIPPASLIPKTTPNHTPPKQMLADVLRMDKPRTMCGYLGEIISEGEELLMAKRIPVGKVFLSNTNAEVETEKILAAKEG
jgi:hypothetical protein